MDYSKRKGASHPERQLWILRRGDVKKYRVVEHLAVSIFFKTVSSDDESHQSFIIFI